MTEVTNLDRPRADALSYSQLQENEHFEVAALNGVWHWESIGELAALGLCSDDGHETAALAADEARDTLALATAYGIETALAMIDELNARMALFYPSDREQIYRACEIIPIDQRWMAIYQMAQRTQAMPTV